MEDAFRNAFSPSAPEFVTPEPQQQPLNIEVLVTTPEDLIREFGTNSVAATDWLKNKRVQVTAPVSYVSNNMFGGDSAAVVFKVRTDDFLQPSVTFWFEGEFRNQVGSIQEGQTVTVEGTFEEQEFGGDLKFEGTSLRL
jgi:hypothetical protein